MYVLHHRPDTAALAVSLVLEELGQSYKLRAVDQDKGTPDDPSYRALQPMGLVPALETPDGPMFETAAILLWLADRHHALAPGPAAADRGQFLKWYFFVVSHLHPVVLQLFYPERSAGSDEAIPAFLALAADRARKTLDHLEATARSGFVWLSPDRPSVLALYLVVLMRWLRFFPAGDARHLDFGAWPTLTAIAKAVEASPAALRAAARDGLGGTFLSNPS